MCPGWRLAVGPPAVGLWSRPCSLPALLSTSGMFVYVSAVSGPGGNAPLAARFQEDGLHQLESMGEVRKEKTLLAAVFN